MEEKPVKSLNKMVLDIYSEKPIAFIPSLAHISGSASSGLFMSQMLYWYGRGSRKNVFYKTFKDFHKETFLNRGEQERAIAVWTKLGVLRKTVFGVPPKRHFWINTDVLLKLLDKAFDDDGNYKSICLDEQNTITESTSENTLQRPVAVRRAPKVHKF